MGSSGRCDLNSGKPSRPVRSHFPPLTRAKLEPFIHGSWNLRKHHPLLMSAKMPAVSSRRPQASSSAQPCHVSHSNSPPANTMSNFRRSVASDSQLPCCFFISLSVIHSSILTSQQNAADSIRPFSSSRSPFCNRSLCRHSRTPSDRYPGNRLHTRSRWGLCRLRPSLVNGCISSAIFHSPQSHASTLSH